MGRVALRIISSVCMVAVAASTDCDCCYLDLALARGTTVITAGRRFRRLADAHTSFAGRMVDLDELEL